MSPAEVCNPPLDLPKSLWHAFLAAADRNPNGFVYSVMVQEANHLDFLKASKKTGDKWLRWTYADLMNATLGMAAGMLERGVKRGGSIITFMPNGIERELLNWVAVALQLMIVPLDEGLLRPGREDELKYYMSMVTPGVAIFGDKIGSERWEKLFSIDACLKICVEPMTQKGWHVFDDIPSSNAQDGAFALVSEQDERLEADGERVQVLIFTSGTSTGGPKGCPRCVRDFLHLAATGGTFQTVPKSIVNSTPNFRSITALMHFATILLQAEVVIAGNGFSAMTTLDTIEKCQVTAIIALPFQISCFLDEVKRRSYQLDCVREVMVGGDVVSIDIIEKTRMIFPKAFVGSSFAMSESISVVGQTGTDPSAPLRTFGSLVNNGRVQPGGMLRICDENRKVIERGQIGELHIAGPVVRCYWNGVQPEAFYEDEKGRWLITGDRALLDDDNWLFVTSRSKDIIKFKQISLSPAVIASTLNKRESIHATVFGIPHSLYGEIPIAVVAAAEPPSDKERIKTIVLDALGPDYALHEVYTLEDLGMSSFPVNQTSKITKLTLKEAVLNLRGRRDSAATSQQISSSTTSTLILIVSSCS